MAYMAHALVHEEHQMLVRERGTDFSTSDLHFRVIGPLRTVQLKSATLKYKITRDHHEFHHPAITKLLEIVAQDPLYIAVDATYADRRQHVAIHWMDIPEVSMQGPYAIILVTEEIEGNSWDIVTAFISRRLPKANPTAGGFIFEKS